MGMILDIAVFSFAYLIGVAAQTIQTNKHKRTTIDACQETNISFHSFDIKASYYPKHPGICTCSISIVNQKSKTGETPLLIKANVAVSDNDACSYLIGPTQSGSDTGNCSTCISSSSLEFRKETNYTLIVGRPYNHTTQSWFEIDVRDNSSKLAVQCWLDDSRTVISPCDNAAPAGPGVGATVTMVNTVQPCADSRTPDLLSIIGWCVSGVLATAIVGFVIYTRLKAKMSNRPNHQEGGDGDTRAHDVNGVTTARGLTFQQADQGESDGEYQIGVIPSYQDFLYRPVNEQVYEAIVDACETKDEMGYERPITTRY